MHTDRHSGPHSQGGRGQQDISCPLGIPYILSGIPYPILGIPKPPGYTLHPLGYTLHPSGSYRATPLPSERIWYQGYPTPLKGPDTRDTLPPRKNLVPEMHYSSERKWYQGYHTPRKDLVSEIPCLPYGQTNTCENITFPQLRWRSVNIYYNQVGNVKLSDHTFGLWNCTRCQSLFKLT